MSLQEVTDLFKESRVKKDLFLIAFCIPLLLLLLFILPNSIKDQLILNYENLRTLNLFTTHFIHKDTIHFGINVMWYLFLVIPSYLLNMFRHQRREFYSMFVLALLVGPIVLSIVSLIIKKYIYSLPIGTSLGFSGIVCILIGYLPYFTLNFLKEFYEWKTRVSMLFLSVLFFSFGFISLVYHIPIMGIITLGFSLAFLYISYKESSLGECLSWLRNARRTHKAIWVLIATNIMLYFGGVLSFFPKELIVGGTFIDVISHISGFVLGIFISLFVGNTNTRTMLSRISDFPIVVNA